MSTRSFNKISLLLCGIFCMTSSLVFAQPGNTSVPAGTKKHWTKNIFVGGGLGGYFGRDQTYLEIAPLVGYRITERLSAGIGGSYIYAKEKLIIDIIDNNGQYIGSKLITLERNNYGVRLFGRYFVLDDVFLHSEFENLNAEVVESVTVDKIFTRRQNIPALFIGGGYAQRLGGGSSLFIMALWDIIEDRYSPYQNPIIRIGVNVGL